MPVLLILSYNKYINITILWKKVDFIKKYEKINLKCWKVNEDIKLFLFILIFFFNTLFNSFKTGVYRSLLAYANILNII